MSKKCQLTGKVANNGYAVSRSHKRTKKLQKVNLQHKKVWLQEENKWVRMLVSTKAIKTLTKIL
uniref:ribosomal protein L28 n=1 Tax=Bangia atropurpurea TaxID=31347 RepID=UPI0007C5E43B|nr:ribosomal protein L28 [Bangia atropurpurea]UNJ18246.1 ribosomal protein L28 [Bangia atropurpurea]